ncbi:MAG: recombination regulator RecX [Treponema sp.]|jgi:regulatory protein|nr:recombination regulator RecX [Treponema sp.]
MYSDEARAETAALRLIARAEQCTQGLSRKLAKRGFETECVNTVISRLLEQNLIDDKRYARLWLQSRLRFARSPLRLLSSLCGKGIERSDAENALKAVLNEETELAMLSRFAKKRQRKARDNDQSARALKYRLKSEGFSAEAIERFLVLNGAT